MSDRVQNVPPRVKFRAYPLLERALEDGAEFGWNRAHKHEDDPPEHYIRQCIVQEQMNALDEIMEFDPETDA